MEGAGVTPFRRVAVTATLSLSLLFLSACSEETRIGPAVKPPEDIVKDTGQPFIIADTGRGEPDLGFDQSADLEPPQPDLPDLPDMALFELETTDDLPSPPETLDLAADTAETEDLLDEVEVKIEVEVAEDVPEVCDELALTKPPTCVEWKCDLNPFPQCWTCQLIPDLQQEGDECLTALNESGNCNAGICEPPPPPNPGDAGPYEYAKSVYQLKLGPGIFAPKLTLVLYLPDDEGPFPVVVFNHGFQLAPAHYASYGEHLASWGFVVIMPNMPSNLLLPKSHEELKDNLVKVLDWIEETGGNPETALEGKADTDKIGVGGHSLGGKISLLACTEDPRPKASFVVDPVDSAAAPLFSNPDDWPSVTPELMPQIDIPLGLLGETVSGSGDNACAPEDENFYQYYLYANSPAVQINVLGASHMSFIDNPDCGYVCSVCPKGTDDPEFTRYLTRKYMTAFYNYQLLELDEFKLYLAGAHMWDDMLDALVDSDSKNDF